MRNWFLGACIALALPGYGFAQQPAAADKASANTPTPSSPSKDTGAQSKLAEMLEAKVKAAWAAFKKKDKDAYAAFLTEDFQAVEADGDGERSKAKTLARSGAQHVYRVLASAFPGAAARTTLRFRHL